MTCFPIVLGGGSQAVSAPTATVGGSTALDAALTAQLGLTALSLSATGLTAGATIAWTAHAPDGSDQTSAIITSGADTATPTWAAFSAATGAKGGQWLIAATVTSGSLSTRYTRRLLVGVAATGGGFWVRKWLFDPSVLADHDFTASALTVDGVEIRNGSEGAVTSFAIVNGVLTLNTAAATGGLWIYPVEALPSSREYEVCWIGGVGAEIAANNDGCFMQYLKNGGAAAFAQVEVRRDGGLQKILRARNGVSASANTAGGLQGRTFGLHMSAGRYAFRPLYSTSAWTANTSPEDLILAGGTTSGWHTSADVTPSETTDEFFPNAIVGAGPDELVVKDRANNSTTYTHAGLSAWGKM